jgi:hypothetical protein
MKDLTAASGRRNSATIFSGKKSPIERLAAYIWMNPVRKGLCNGPLEYPHSGSRVVFPTQTAGTQETRKAAATKHSHAVIVGPR